VGIMTKTLKGLFPPDWSLVKDLRAVVEALSLSFERIRVFLNGVITESEPSTAVETLEEWFTQEGINYDPSQSTARLQELATSVNFAPSGILFAGNGSSVRGKQFTNPGAGLNV